MNNAVAISAGGAYGLALKNDGTVTGWGYNNWGQTSPPDGLNGVVAVSAGYDHSLALKSDGTVVAWGHSAYGGTTIHAGLNDVIAIAAGVSHCLALVGDGPPALQAAATGFQNAKGQPGVAIPTQSGRVYGL